MKTYEEIDFLSLFGNRFPLRKEASFLLKEDMDCQLINIKQKSFKEQISWRSLILESISVSDNLGDYR